jgi:hypothetical protein
MEYATALIFFFGKLFYPLPIFEISLGFLALVNISKNHQIKNKYFLYFLIFSFVTARFTNFTSFFYFIRLGVLLSFFIFPPKFSQKFKNFFSIILIANILFGLIQYFIWPNFTYFNALNWDPHLFRLVSTFFDPTFTGLIYLLFLINIFFQSLSYYYLIIPYIALSLTYSRSTLLSFLIAFFFISQKYKKPKIFLVSLLIFLITIFVLPRLEGEGTKLERTSSILAKIENYKEGIVIFKKNPIIGVGYNNLKIARNLSQNPSHSSSGFDGSLLTILTTTGLIGLSLFVLGLKEYFQKTDLLHQTLLITILFHSLFSNSLLYPFVLFVLFAV